MSQFAHASLRGLIESEGTYLFLKHEMPAGPIWGIPGGRAEIGESPRETVEREVLEETGLRVRARDPLEAYAYTWADGEKGTVSVVFDCDLLDSRDAVDLEANPCPEEPITEYGWLEPAEIANAPMNDALRELLTGRR
ncbi:NUDIX domain-containing protein [Natrononativus amylolyticus]|uniref:NUDIX domain-containing protein n=1 Tax=Natrononativus amylolyticus TaxID=2963434 RepID=UPI0020CFBB4B|nr:NUDIX hydrolase [Natrononativus amylolyticus]